LFIWSVSGHLYFLLTVPIEQETRHPEVWGSDAGEWNPRRFLHLDKEKQISVGLYANL
jgi:hypothetical protein